MPEHKPLEGTGTVDTRDHGEAEKTETLALRPATMDDAAFLLDLRNDETVRKNSFHHDVIGMEEHVKWLSRVLRAQEQDGSRRLFILMNGDEKAGQVRIDQSDDDPGSFEISYSIAAAFRGRGYGNRIIALLEEKLRKEAESPEGSDSSKNPRAKTLTAAVFRSNPASIRVFERNGYTRIRENGEVITFLKTL